MCNDSYSINVLFIIYIEQKKTDCLCDPDATNKLSFQLTLKAPCKLLALISQMILEDKTFYIGIDDVYDEDDGRCCMGILFY